MNIDEAINILGYRGQARPLFGNQKVEEALKLGIEALKFCKVYKRRSPNPSASLLKGETEE